MMKQGSEMRFILFFFFLHSYVQEKKVEDVTCLFLFHFEAVKRKAVARVLFFPSRSCRKETSSCVCFFSPPLKLRGGLRVRVFSPPRRLSLGKINDWETCGGGEGRGAKIVSISPQSVNLSLRKFRILQNSLDIFLVVSGKVCDY